MLKHYLITALRHFAKHRTATVINVVCLALGFICFFAAHLVVTWSQSSDRQFAKSDRIYAITERMSVGGNDVVVPRAGGLAAQYLKTDFPQLEAVARATFGGETMIAADAKRIALRASFADAEFLNVFALPFVVGDSKAALRNPHGAIVTADAAMKLFGTTDVLGRRVRDGEDELTITGVIAAIKQPSHMGTGPLNLLRFDVLVAMDVLEHRTSTGRMLKRWQVSPAFTYVVLPKDGTLSASAFREQLKSFASRHVSREACACDFGAIAISELGATGFDGVLGAAKTGLTSAALLYLICSLVLAIACINYANLVTAQAAARAKETGMRRVIGARRAQIVAQHLIEAVVQASAALVIAAIVLALAVQAIPLPGKEFAASFAVRSGFFWIVSITATICTILIAGAYPALVLSRINPSHALRGARGAGGSQRLRTMLIGVQFAVASALLIGILVMHAQNKEMQRAALETAHDPLVVLTSNLRFAGINFGLLRSELQLQPHVHSVSGAMFAPWGNAGCNQESVTSSHNVGARRWIVCGISVAQDFFTTAGIQLLAGRAFDFKYANEDKDADRNVVIDRALAEQYGWTNPQSAVNKDLYLLNWFDNSQPPQALHVIGVVENKMLAPVGYGATSYLYDFAPSVARFPIVRIAKADVPAALKEISAVWTELSPNYPLQWKFADEILNATYSLFISLSRAFLIITGLAFSIAMLGLIGMSMHIIGRRTHEIGVRKTLGANVREILSLLLKDFSKPVLIANLLAWPVAYLTMQSYLDVFTKRVAFGAAPFIGSLVIVLLVAWLAVCVQVTRAARTNPATVLRHE